MSEAIASIQTVVHVGADGMLNLQLPLEVANADFEVTVNLKQVPSMPEKSEDEADEAAAQEEWRRYIMESSGSIDDPTSFRHDQGELEVREELP